MNDTLSRLINAARQAVSRGDMYVGLETEFLGVRDLSRLMDIPIGVFDGRVLLKLKVPRKAVAPSGELVSIVSHYGGTYYGLGGGKYTINELAFIEEKRLP